MSTPRIASVQFFRAESPLSRPIADATHEISAIRFVVARITLTNGVTGEGYLLAFDFNPAAVAGVLADVRPLAVGRTVSETVAFNRVCDQAFEYFGNTGLSRWARGIINIAMWDAWGRHLRQPIWKILGTAEDRVPVYGSGGWLSYSIDELLDEVTRYAKRGFQAVKIKVGSRDSAADLERLAKVRERVGPHIRVMIDANQGLTYPAALDLARRAQPYGIHWFEEPLEHGDFDGYASLRQNAGLALAMGEREYDLVPLRELVRRGGIDLWQPDILRLGGVEDWLESAAFARAHRLPVLAHYYKEYDAALAVTIPNAAGVESFDWVDGIIDRPLHIADGYAYPSAESGWGFSFKPDALTEIVP
jgi:L-alanine-DL-glutamate epimerase-like enolase superfamily enzyme